MTPREFIEGWARAGGRSAGEIAEWLGSFTDEDWRAADSSRRERWPGDAPIAFETLAQSSFPKVLVRGAWAAEIAPGRELTGNAFRAVCETIAERADGRIVVFEDSSHNPQLQEPDRFNRLLREIWDSAA